MQRRIKLAFSCITACLALKKGFSSHVLPPFRMLSGIDAHYTTYIIETRCSRFTIRYLQMLTAFGDALLAPLPLETQTQFRRLWHNIGNTLRGVQQACSNGVRQIVSAT